MEVICDHAKHKDCLSDKCDHKKPHECKHKPFPECFGKDNQLLFLVKCIQCREK